MRTTNILLTLLLPLYLGSYAPKVITDLVKSYSPRVTVDVVSLYEVGQEVLESAELIGCVKVVDSGASTKCNYE